MIVSLDANAIYQGPNAYAYWAMRLMLDGMLLTPHLEAANEAIITALSAGA